MDNSGYIKLRREARHADFLREVERVADGAGCQAGTSNSASPVDEATRLELASEAGRLGLWDWHVPSGAIHMNARYRGMLGLDESPPTVPFDAVAESIHPDDRPGVLDALHRLLRGEAEYYEHEYRIRTRDGRWRWLWARAVVAHRHGDGLPIWVSGVRMDITDRKEALEKLRASEELHRLTLSTISDAVFLTDEDGRFRYICPNVHIIFGHGPEEVETMGTIDRLLGEGLFEQRELDEKGELKNIERSILDKDGQRHVLLVNIKRVDIQGGTRLYTCRDFTEAQELHATMLNDRLAVRKKNIALREILETVQHKKRQVARQVNENVNTTIRPLLEKLERYVETGGQDVLRELHRGLEELLSPLASRLGEPARGLTPSEIRICEYIRQGLGSKEIARRLSCSPQTVSTHRRSIRRKLGIANQPVNLATYLRRLQQGGDIPDVENPPG